MSTTRHRRRTWQQAGFQAAVGILIAVDTALTIHSHNGLLHLAAAVLGVVAGMLIAGALSYATSIGWHRARHMYLVRPVAQAPLRRPLYPLVVDDSDNRNAEVAQHYATRADNWRNDIPGGLDAITGPRRYLPPDPDAAEALADW